MKVTIKKVIDAIKILLMYYLNYFIKLYLKYFKFQNFQSLN